MISPRHLLVTATLFGLMPQPMFGQLIVVEGIVVPKDQGAALVTAALPGKDLRTRALKLGETDRLLLARIEGSVKLNEILEFWYPTEFDPPERPLTVIFLDPEGKPRPTTAADPPLIGHPVPTTFEMKPLGWEVELKSVDGLLEYAITGGHLLKMTKRDGVDQPIFSTASLKGRVDLKPENTAFIGSMALDEDRSVLVFLSSVADQPAGKPTTATDQFVVKVEVVSLPLTEVAEACQSGKAAVLTRKAIESGRTETVMQLKGRAGVPISLFSNEDHWYPTEYDPPDLPRNVIIADTKLIEKEDGNPLAGPPWPTTFELKPLGESLEVNLGAVDAGSIALDFSFSMTSFVGTNTYTGCQQPVFESRQLVNHLKVPIGDRVLVGTLSHAPSHGFGAEKEPSTVSLVFVTITPDEPEGEKLTQGADVRTLTEMFTVPRDKGWALLSANHTDEALHKALSLAALDPSEGRVELMVRSGRLTQGHSQNELMAPTEYDPPGALTPGILPESVIPETVLIGGSAGRVNQLLRGVPKNKEPTFRPTPTTFDYLGLGHEIWSESLTTARGFETSLSWKLLRYVGTPLGPAHPEPSRFEHRLTTSIRSSVGVPCLISAASATPRSGTPFESESKEMGFTFLTSYQVGRRWQIAEPKTNEDAFADPQPESPNKRPKPMPLEAAVFFDMISIPTQKAPAMLAGTEDGALYESLKKLLSQGAAKRELALSGRLHEGECVLDEGREHNFSTEFHPPQLLEVFHITSAEDLSSLQAGNTKTIGTPTGTTTESWPLGAHVELEATRESQGWAVKAESKIRKLIGERNYSGCIQPLFEFQSLSTGRFMEPGETQLLGTLSPAQNTGTPEVNKDGRTWFAFLKMSLP